MTYGENNKMTRLSTKTHPFLSELVIDKLFSNRIFTVTNFIEADVRQLAKITNLTYKNILTIRKHIINKNAAVTRNGLDAFREWMNKNALLQTGIPNIDSVLNGGLVTGHIYELCGLPASGKTQFCLTVTKNIVQQLQQHVYYLDCKGDFNAIRIKHMLDVGKIKSSEAANILAKILVKRVTTLNELINSMHYIKNEIHNGLNVKLIIIDSMPTLLYQFKEIFQSSGILNHLINIMKFMACEYYTCFVVTNVLTTWYMGNVGEENVLSEKIGSGKYWQSVSNTRLKFVRMNCGKFEISVDKSIEIPMDKKCTVSICDLGVI